MDKNELIDLVKKNMEKYETEQKKCLELYKEERKIVNETNYAILSLLFPEQIHKLDSFIGKKIEFCNGIRLYILNVSSVKYDKWELTISGNGVFYDFECGTIYDTSSIHIKYDNWPNIIDKISVCVSESIKNIEDKIESYRKEAIESAISKINKKYDDILNAIHSNDKVEYPDYLSLAEGPLERMTRYKSIQELEAVINMKSGEKDVDSMNLDNEE